MSETIQAAWSDAARAAAAASKKAKSSGLASDHKAAADLHGIAADHHSELSISTSGARSDSHAEKSEHHISMAEFHDKQSGANKATSTESSDVVRAAGTSEGAKKGWVERRGFHLSEMAQTESLTGKRAHLASVKAWKTGKSDDHHKAGLEHLASMEEAKGNEKLQAVHEKCLLEHAEESGDKAKASDATSTEVIHCRSHSAAGSVLAADKPWSPGEQVEFMWMPAGTSTICAGFRKGSIELTVNCDENTAAAVQASLENWREERPKQEPFGCIEHKEQEASFRVGASCGFKWNDDGVYLAAEPTTLGANNVNGRVHRSWSPSFTTDADYSKATECGGVLMFPEGARGSRSNPAQITGVDFCVGTLTNKPAFHSMSPVKASDAVKAAGTSEGVAKSWESRKRHASNLTTLADREHFTAMHKDTPEAHEHAAAAHDKARASHAEMKGHESYSEDHEDFENYHKHAAESHRNMGQAASVFGSFKRDATSSSTINAHCAETLKQDVPDATPAEVACYEKCLKDGGSHTRAVEEIRKQRNPAAKASLEEIYDKVTGSTSSDTVTAVWSDAARKAAIESRKAHALSKDAMAGTPYAKPFDSSELKKGAGADVHADYAANFAEKGNHFTASVRHRDAADHHKRLIKHNIGNPEKHAAAMKAHQKLESVHKGLHNESKSSNDDFGNQGQDEWMNTRASDTTTPDTILARQASVLEQANAIATEHGVARTTLDDVYSKCAVSAAWSDSARKAALEARRNQAHAYSHDAYVGKVEFGKGGSSKSAILQHEDVAKVAALKPGESHSFKDETGEHWNVHHDDGGRAHFAATGGGAMYGHVPHAAIAEHGRKIERGDKGGGKTFAADATPQDILNKIYASSGHSTNVVKAHCGKLLGLLGSLRAAHWNAPTQTNDHEALGKLYETLDGLVDEYVESSMGKKPEKVTPESCDCDPNDPAAVLDAGERIVTGMRGDREDLNNLVADMEKAINKTRYLLKAGAAGGPIQTSDKSVDDILNSIYARAETVSATWSPESRRAAFEARMAKSGAAPSVASIPNPDETEKMVLHHDAMSHEAARSGDMKGFEAHQASKEAYSVGEKASDGSGRATHNEANIAHNKASGKHLAAGNEDLYHKHSGIGEAHGKESANQFKQARLKKEQTGKSSSTSEIDWRKASRDYSYKHGSDD
jgi:hypothetical protein